MLAILDFANIPIETWFKIIVSFIYYLGIFSKSSSCQHISMLTKIYSCKYGQVNTYAWIRNKDRNFKYQISYFLIPAPTCSPTFSDQRCKPNQNNGRQFHDEETPVGIQVDYLELGLKHQKLSMQG